MNHIRFGELNQPQRLKLRTTGAVILGGAAALLSAAWISVWSPPGPSALGLTYLGQVGVLYGVVAAGVLAGIGRHLPHARFGPANSITLVRAVITCLIGGLIGLAADGEGWGWAPAAAGTVALLLDGVDGWIARRQRIASVFGARFDMEVDGLLLLILAVLVMETGKVAAWVVAIGGMRYLFVAAGAVWPWLRRDLPPSIRCKAVCVVQGLALILCLTPAVGPVTASAAAAAALALLVFSFATDSLWLYRQGVRGAPQ